MGKKFNFVQKALNYILAITVVIVIVSIASSKEDTAILDKKEPLDFSKSWDFFVNGTLEEKSIDLPIFEKAKALDKVVIRKKLPNNTEGKVIFFRSLQSRARVKVEGDEIYSYGYEGNNKLNSITASSWITAPLDTKDAGKTLEIELVSKYKKYSGSINPVFIGNKSEVISLIIKRSLTGIIASVSMLIIGLISIMMSIFFKRIDAGKNLFYLGTFALFSSLWTMGELRFLQIFIGKNSAILNLTIISLWLGYISFLTFLSTFDFYGEDKSLNALIITTDISFVLVMGLHISNIKDLYETLPLSHILIVVSGVYIVHKLIGFILKKDYQLEKTVLNVSIVMFFLISFMDLVIYYISPTYMIGSSLRFGLLSYIIVMSFYVGKKISRTTVKNMEIDILKKIAYTDPLTGMYNRNAFEKKISNENNKKTGFNTIIMVDMNNLKLINDNFGHSMGDEAIKFVADLMKRHMKNIGKCYRIGGDEFCIMIDDRISKEYIHEKFREINNKILKESKRFPTRPLLAYGFSYCNPTDDMVEVIKKSDKVMYSRKTRMKKAEADKLSVINVTF